MVFYLPPLQRLLLAMAGERGITQYSVASCWIATGHHDQLPWRMLPAMQIIKNLVWPVATASFATDSIIIIQTKARTYKHWRYSSKIAHAKKVELEYLAVLWLCEGVWYSKLHFSYLLNRRLRDCIHDGRSDDFDVLKQGWIQHDLVGGGGGVLCQLWYRVVTVMCPVRPSTCLTTAKSCLTIVFEL
jgi:hypothetical protein